MAARSPRTTTAELSVVGAALPLMGWVTGSIPGRDLVAGGALRAEGDPALLDVLPECFDFSPDGPSGREASGP
jgi:hypothetical protein